MSGIQVHDGDAAAQPIDLHLLDWHMRYWAEFIDQNRPTSFEVNDLSDIGQHALALFHAIETEIEMRETK